MISRFKFELSRWIYFFVLFFLCTGFIVIVSEFAVGPALQWLLHDIHYQLPTWHRVVRMSLFVLFMGFFAGTIAWVYEKKASGR